MGSSIAFMTEAWRDDPQVIAVVPVVDGTRLTDLEDSSRRSNPASRSNAWIAVAALAPTWDRA